LGDIYPELENKRIFVGDMSRLSSLEKISRYFAVVDRDNNEIFSGTRPVRVSAVTRGQRGGFPPAFANETSSSTTPLSNTTGVLADGGNALGVNRTKESANINSVLFGTSVICNSATFIANGVVAGDIATITGSTIDVPFNHNGTYIVETVVSETELILRPSSPDELRGLNMESGDKGFLAVRSGGEFESNLFVTFDPPITAFPESGQIHILLGVEQDIGEIGVSDLLASNTWRSPRVDDPSFDRAYNGTSVDGAVGRAAGFFARVDDRPITLSVGGSPIPDDGRPREGFATAKTGNGEIVSGNILQLSTGPDLLVEDTGKVVRIFGGPTLEQEVFVIQRILDPRTVLLAPTRSSLFGSVSIPVGVCQYTIYNNARAELESAIQIISQGNSGDSGQTGLGLVYDRRYGTANTAAPLYGQSLVHAERVKLHNTAGNISVFEITFDGSDTIGLPFDPEASYNIWGSEGSDTRGDQRRSASLLKIHNGVYAGVYRVAFTKSSTVTTDSVQLMHLDGTPVTFAVTADTIYASFYNVHLATKHPIKGAANTSGLASSFAVSGLHLYTDNAESDVGITSPALSVDWRGAGHGIGMWLNDSNFTTLSSGDGAQGNAIFIRGWAPANGISVRLTAKDSTDATTDNRAVYGLESAVFSNAAYLEQTGSGYVGFDGWSGRFWQGGFDPGVIIQRVAYAGSVVPTGLGQFSNTAALKVANSNNSADTYSGQGSAAEVLGSFYVFRKSVMDGHQYDDGGVFVETVASARWIHPIHSGEGEHYYGNAAITTAFGDPTQLGSPGQIFPTSAADADLSGNLYGPDYFQFNVPHKLLLEASQFDNGTPSLWIGQRVSFTSGTFAGLEFHIIGARSVFAILEGPSSPSLPSGSSESVDFKILGQRWHYAYLNVADYMQVGVRNHPASNEYAPTIYKAGIAAAMSVAIPDLDVSAAPQIKAEGLLGSLQVFPNTEGGNVGESKTLANMPGFPAVTWAARANEPRAPFPNRGVLKVGADASDLIALGAISLTVGASNRSVERKVHTKTDFGSLLSDSVVLVHPPAIPAPFTATTYGAVMYWSEDTYGNLRVETDQRNAASDGAIKADLAQVIGKGIRGVSQATLAIQVSTIVQVPGTSTGFDVVVDLVKEDGTSFLSSGTLTFSYASATDKTTEVVYVFELHDLDNKAHDYLEEMILNGEGLFPSFTLLVWNNFVPNYLSKYNVLRFTNRLITREIKQIGGIDVQGAVIAHQYRYRSPIEGYQTISPAFVSLLNGTEFGYPKRTSLPYESSGDVGLVKYNFDPENGSDADDQLWLEPVYSQSDFFRKSHFSAAIVGYHPFFDPLWYRVVESVIGLDTVPPTRTGFLIPLEPPHGSILNSLELSLSFRMALNPRATGSDPEISLGVWHSSVITNLMPDWDGVEGVKIRLWRHNCLPFGGEYAVTAPMTSGIENAFPEQIFTQNVSVPSTGINTLDITSSEITGNGSQGNEQEVFKQFALRQIVSDESKLVVDRRHFAYYLTVEFYLGARDILELPGDNEYTYFDETNANALPVQGMYQEDVRPVTNGSQIYRFNSKYTMNKFAPNSNQYMGARPPVVKFRGARLGWTTTKPGNGF
jgi:hypothetical protein